MTENVTYTTAKEIIKPDTDEYLYRGIILENKLKVLLIQNTKSTQAYASLNVGVGSLVDPVEFNGLAHFCEHMLSMGTKKFPGINDYSKKLAETGGSENAFTTPWSTNYHFETSNEYLEQILEMFSDQFINPNFDASAVDKEINAVDSESVNSLKNDSQRIYQLNRL